VSLVYLVIYALVSFRVTELLVIDDGPFDLFANIRGWFNRAPFDNSIRRNISVALSCVHCTGLWVSLALGAVYHYVGGVTISWAIVFSIAVAGLQSILANKFGRQNGSHT
jgi:hypothetical protein